MQFNLVCRRMRTWRLDLDNASYNNLFFSASNSILTISELIEAFKANLIKSVTSDWRHILIHSETRFLISRTYSRFDYVVELINTPINSYFIFEHDNYSEAFWKKFPSRLTSVCDQMIIFQVHHS